MLGGVERIELQSGTWSDGFIVNLGLDELEGDGKGVPPQDLGNWHVDGDFFVCLWKCVSVITCFNLMHRFITSIHRSRPFSSFLSSQRSNLVGVERSSALKVSTLLPTTSPNTQRACSQLAFRSRPPHRHMKITKTTQGTGHISRRSNTARISSRSRVKWVTLYSCTR